MKLYGGWASANDDGIITERWEQRDLRNHATRSLISHLQNLGSRAAEQLAEGHVRISLSVVPGLESRCQLPGWASLHSSGYPIPGHVINLAKHVGTHRLTVSRMGWTRAVEGSLPPITTDLHLQSFKVKGKQNLPQTGGDICNEMRLAHSTLSSTADRAAKKETRRPGP